jgi:2-polyprenyl-6-methoxyphenol hydroxylase-like FAD-dependent oxidoreductase
MATRPAVVLGASMAGLLAARALSAHFERVIVVERDSLPDDASARKGTPQARHVHGLLLRGADAFEGLLPGFGADLDAKGAVTINAGGDIAFLTAFGWMSPFTPPLPMRTATRDLMESVVRRHARKPPNVEFLDQHDVEGLLHRDGVVTGVHVSDRKPGGAEREIHAELVVDATGRGSRAPEWLRALRFAVPEDTVVDSFVGYASRLFRGAPRIPDGHRAAFLMPRPPAMKRGGVLFPHEDNLFLVTLAGAIRDYPPSDEAGFLEFARSLRAPHIYEALRAATPVSDISISRSTANRLRHFDRMSRWPSGLVVVGDAVCAFNPIYGQGMTVAALEATALGEMLRRGTFDARRFQQSIAKIVAPVWEMATLEDFRYHETVGQRPSGARLGHAYMDAVFALAPHDAWAAERVSRVFQLLLPTTALFAPSMLIRLVRAFVRGNGQQAGPGVPHVAKAG